MAAGGNMWTDTRCIRIDGAGSEHLACLPRASCLPIPLCHRRRIVRSFICTPQFGPRPAYLGASSIGAGMLVAPATLIETFAERRLDIVDDSLASHVPNALQVEITVADPMVRTTSAPALAYAVCLDAQKLNVRSHTFTLAPPAR